MCSLIRSMTGYGRGECKLHDRQITVEVRSVNNRYLDCSVKIPRLYIFAEETMKARIKQSISRGKVDVFVSIDSPSAEQIVINRPVADGYYAALTALHETYQLQDDRSVSLLAKMPDVFLVEKAQEDLETVTADLCQVLNMALTDFDAMRVREGIKLEEDVVAREQTIQTLLQTIEERSPQTVVAYREKLTQRMMEVLQNTQIDENRILMEAAIFADKVAVDEETVRLRSHLAQLDEMLQKGGIIGRKLDFLIQEFNREANTIGSKCSDVDMSRTVVDMKGEIEKIREQVQNIE